MAGRDGHKTRHAHEERMRRFSLKK
jgi:hypothetical protein